MNIKTILILAVLAVILLGAFKALWKHLKGEGSCSCGGNCSEKKGEHHHEEHHHHEEGHSHEGCCCGHKK